MGQTYLPQRLERIILRHYDDSVSNVVQEFVTDGLREEGLLDENDNYAQGERDL